MNQPSIPRPEAAREGRPLARFRGPLTALAAGLAAAVAAGWLDAPLAHVTGEASRGLLLVRMGASAALAACLVHRWMERRREARERERSQHLLDLARAVNAVSSNGDYGIRALRRADGELGLLVETVNHLLTRTQSHERRLLERAERAESENHERMQGLASMSHELRTPLTGILGMADLLAEGGADDEQRELARALHASAEGLLELVNDILDVSKGEARAHQLEAIPFSIEDLVNTCGRTVEVLAQEKGLELVTELDSDLPERLVGDPTRLRQVLLNLLGNAIKFTAEGSVTLSVTRASSALGAGRLASEDELVRVRLEVRDSGIGIPEDVRERLFQSYAQASADHARRFGGTGLGLAISRQLVEAMGGIIDVQSTEGEGSTFGITLELPEGEGTAGLANLRALVVAGEEEAQAIDGLLPNCELVRVHSALAGRQTLLSTDGEPFDVVILALELAEEFGIDSSVPEFPRVPLVLLGCPGSMDIGRPLHWPTASIYATRPVTAVGLRHCLDEVVAPESRHRSAAPPHTFERPDDLLAKEEDHGAGSGPNVARVLVAEDHPVNRRLLAGYLDLLGVEHEIVEDGQQAVEAHAARPFDLILMDRRMPVMDGAEATRRIRAAEGPDIEPVAILSMTASAEPAELEEMERAGCNGHLSKPLRRVDLEVALAGRRVHTLAA